MIDLPGEVRFLEKVQEKVVKQMLNQFSIQLQSILQIKHAHQKGRERADFNIVTSKLNLNWMAESVSQSTDTATVDFTEGDPEYMTHDCTLHVLSSDTGFHSE